MSGYCWLASYPKSGNTWIRLALRSLYHGGAAVDFTAAPFAPAATLRIELEAALGLASDELTDDEIEALRPRAWELLAGEAPEPLLRKTHDAWTLTSLGEPLLPPAVTRAAVYIVRDPRDVAVSLAHHARIPVEEAVRIMSDDRASLPPQQEQGWIHVRQRLLTWSGHVTSWLRTSGVRPLLVRYEDMLEDPIGTLGCVASHLPFAFDPEAIRRAVEATRFDVLRAEEERVGFREKATGMTTFFRRGRAGGWRDSLSPELAARIGRDHGDVMAMLGYSQDL